MTTRAESPPLAWLWRPRRAPAAMRVRRRWGAYARQSAVNEILSQLALAADEGASLLETMRLTSRAPVRPASSVPAVRILTILGLLVLTAVLAVIPGLLSLSAIVTAVLAIFVFLHACRDNLLLQHVSLAESELAHRLADAMDQGEPLSQAMAAEPRIFTHAQVATVQAGERASNLGPALQCLSREAQVRQSAGVLTFHRHYPIIAFFLISGIAAFIFDRIIPKFVDIFSQLGLELPELTRTVVGLFGFPHIGLDDLTLGYLGLVVLLCFYMDHLVRLHLGRLASGVVCVAWVLPLLSAGFSRMVTRLGIRVDDVVLFLIVEGLLVTAGLLMPIAFDGIRGLWALGSSAVAHLLPWWRRRRCTLDRANFLESLGLMLDRRVPAPEALRLAAPTLSPAGLAGRAERAAEAVERGEAMITVLVRMSLVQGREEALLRLAAAAGDLPAECGRLSEHLAEEARLHIARIERMIRPLSVLAVAAIAGVILLSIYLPLFQVAVVSTR